MTKEVNQKRPEDWCKRQLWCPELAEAQLPWLGAVLPRWRAFRGLKRWPAVTAYNETTGTPQASSGVTFVKSPPKRALRKLKLAGSLMPYDARVAYKQEVWTREHNWHDFFNMLIWSVLPQTKMALHTRQTTLSQDTVQDEAHGANARNPEQNNLTRFDEGGAILVCAPRHLDALQDETRREELLARVVQGVERPEDDQPACTEAKREGGLGSALSFGGGDDSIEGIGVFILGHALFETMLARRWDVRAMAALLPVEETFFSLPLESRYARLDRRLSAFLASGAVADKAGFWGLPLPAIDALLKHAWHDTLLSRSWVE